MPPPEPPAHFVPRRLWAIIKPALEKDPASRYGSCELFADALRAWAADPDVREPKPAELLVAVHETLPKIGGQQSPRQRAVAPADLKTQAPRIALDCVSLRPTLIVRTGKESGARFELSGRHVVGRHPRYAHIVIDEEKISNSHACIEAVVLNPNAPVFTVLDLASMNGTAVDGVPLGSDSQPLNTQLATLTPGQVVSFDDVEAALLPAGRLGPGNLWQSPEEAAAYDAQVALEALEAEAQAPSPADPSTPAHGCADAAPLAPVAARTPARGVSMIAPKPKLQRVKVGLGESWLVPTFAIMYGGDRALRFIAGEEGIIGADPTKANIVIDERHISGAHLRYSRVTGTGDDVTYSFQDLKSRNGVFGKYSGVDQKVASGVMEARNRIRLGPEVSLCLLPPGHFDDLGVFIAASDKPAGPEPATQAPPPPSSTRSLGAEW